MKRSVQFPPARRSSSRLLGGGHLGRTQPGGRHESASPRSGPAVSGGVNRARNTSPLRPPIGSRDNQTRVLGSNHPKLRLTGRGGTTTTTTAAGRAVPQMSGPIGSGGADGPDLGVARSIAVITGLRVSLKVAVCWDGLGQLP